MVHALIPLDDHQQPIPQDICGEPNEVLALQHNLVHWLTGTLLPEQAEAFAVALSEKVRRMWGGIQTVVTDPSSGNVPRFIAELDTWSRGILAAELALDGERLEEVAQNIKRSVWSHYAGSVLYFRKKDPQRNHKIFRDWQKCGDIVDLARKWNLTTPQLYEIINHETRLKSHLP